MQLFPHIEHTNDPETEIGNVMPNQTQYAVHWDRLSMNEFLTTATKFM